MTVDVTEIDLGRGVRGVKLENEHLSIVVTPDKGADILSIRHKARGFDPMWVSPWGVRQPGQIATAPNSQVAWMDAYAGGWQELFPNGGTACTIEGADLPFHGEASVSAWEWDVLPDGVRFFIRLVRSPYVLERTMRLQPDRAAFTLEGRATNMGRVPLPYMWSHHPAFGAPFLSGDCLIETNAAKLLADPVAPGPLLEPGSKHDWPIAASGDTTIDLSRVPGEDESRFLMAYLAEFPADNAWYAIKNVKDGTRIEYAWDPADYPYAWLWQEMHSQMNGPWYGEAYVMAIEPATSWPGGLANVMATTKTHRITQPGDVATNRLTITLSHD